MLYTSFIEENFLYIIMEYCGSSIYDILSTKYPKGLDNHDLIVCILYQVLKALNYLHENNLLHRNLKSNNILINSQGICKITDFENSKCIIFSY
jgi:mitogen-activated protein kinase kinase kinase